MGLQQTQQTDRQQERQAALHPTPTPFQKFGSIQIPGYLHISLH
jgi:hypothetical protein